MTPPRKPKSGSARARAMHARHPDWSLQRIADECGITRQAVSKALAADPTDRGGRKPDPAARVARLRRELAAAERELAATAVAGRAPAGGVR